MSNAEVTINGQGYQTGRLSAMQQFHLMRRLAPLLGTLGAGLTGLDGVSDLGSDDAAKAVAAKQQLLTVIAEVLTGPFASALAAVPDVEAEYVLNTCLSVVGRKTMTGPVAHYPPIRNARGSLQYDDIDLPVMLQLTVEVLKENLSGFFATAQPAS